MRSREILLSLAVLTGLTVGAAPALAQKPPITTADQPAATLLLPYFEVDLANPAGANTFFTVNNASATATLAHVTVWSAMHVPVYSFDIYLTGYDAQPLNVRDIINGKLPATASAGQDDGDPLPLDSISPKGVYSQDITFASCEGVLPAPAVPQETVDHIRAALTGQPSALAGGMCATRSDGTSIARGYITVDTTNVCTSLTPADVGYFVSGGLGIASNRNLLWGDYVYTNHLGGLESGDGSPLVHIRADENDPDMSTPGKYTFYGRLVSWAASDNREPLSTNFMAHFTVGLTTLTVWRDPKINQSYFGCAIGPAWYPLGSEQVLVFDEQERTEFSTGTPFAPQPPGELASFPTGAQRVQVGTAELPAIYPVGVLWMNLNTVVSGQSGLIADPLAAQAWVDVHQKGAGRYSIGWPAVMLDSAREAMHIVF